MRNYLFERPHRGRCPIGIFLVVALLLFVCGPIAAQNTIRVSGVVKDIHGEPIIGASISLKEVLQGTVTDIDGRYSLNAEPDQSLVFSYIGYKEQTIAIAGRTEINMVLEEDFKQLDEVVIVGYGTQIRKNIVGAVDNISGEVLQNRPNAYLLRSMQGQVPGVNITMVDGKPSRSATINIRANRQTIGEGSSGGNALCLIDGVEGDLTTVNPEDVESISILKDASSTAVYGSRGAFGVVLVTTKNATEGKVSVNYSGVLSIYRQTVRPELETDSQIWYDNFKNAHVSYRHALPTGINNFFPWSESWEREYKKRMNDPDNSYMDWALGTDGTYQYYGKNTNWYDEFYRNETYGHQHNLRVSGGNNMASYVVSARYFEQDGIYRVGDEKFRQMNVRAKGTIKLTDWLTVENNTDFVRRTYHQPMVYPTDLTVPRNLEHQGFPVTKVKNPDGSWTAAAVYTGYAGMAEGVTYRDNFKYDMKNSTVLTIDLIKDVLVAKADYTYLYNHSKRRDVANSVTYSSGPNIQVTYPLTGFLDLREYENEYHNANAFLTYTPKLREDHSFSMMGGWNLEYKRYNNTRISRDGFIREDTPNFSLMDGIDYTVLDGGSDRWGFMGIFYRLNYGYKGKYLAELSGRYDGSSKFPLNEQWGFFPSASIGWRMSEEKFMHDIPWLDNLKWRFSIGSAGNGNVSSYLYRQTHSFYKAAVITNGNQETYTTSPSIIPNSLTWEKSSTTDLGVDINMLRGRLSFVADYYVKTTDMIVSGDELPAVAGYAAPLGNNADMSTTGIELALGWNDGFQLAGKRFNYNTRISFWDSKSKIIKYTSKTNRLPTIYSNAYYEGMEMGEIWGYKVDGLFATDEEAQDWGVRAQSKTFWSGDNTSWNAGDLRFADLNNDGVIDNGKGTLDDHGDLIKIGNSDPRYHFGINLGANWNGIGLSLFFQGIMKRDWYPAGESGLFWGQYNRTYGYSLPWQNAHRWTEENQNINAYWPRLRGSLAATGRGTLRAPNDRYLQNARYTRLKNITVDYTLPKDISKKIYLENVKLYVSGENLFFWSPLKKYAKNYDPEQITPGDSDYRATRGTDGDGYGYPQTKSITFGVNVSF